jgi:hypothetical protein
MTKEDIQLLYKYDRWANNKMFQAASALTGEAFTRDLGGSFCSVRRHAGTHHRWRVDLACLLEGAAPKPCRIDKLENATGRSVQPARIAQRC